ncbi:Uncharacterised protein [Serratia odorifera]|uniref:Haemolysin activator HlyB C-terminal domain-containing protein n=1 Tax=Serratia odorifera TaxID=618 RepID=A0A3S4F1H2_SEROD|nr:Uncharacterised protein [Serratia odorifera]
MAQRTGLEPVGTRPRTVRRAGLRRVDGPGTRYLVGHQLAGSAIGLRGTLWGRFSYDLFAGVPVYKPDHFVTSSVTSGFSLNLEI